MNRYLILIFSALCLSGCGPSEPEIRRYTEHIPAAQPMMQQGMGAEAGELPAPGPARIRWEAPAGWTETRGQGMRVATFVPQAAPGSECTLVVLGPAAGSLEANVERWAGQVGVTTITQEQITQACTPLEQVNAAFSGTLVDLSALVPAGTDQPSMLAAVLQGQGMSVFVKFTAPSAGLTGERARFLALCASIQPASEEEGR